MRKVACLAVFMALMMLVPVQAGGDVSIQQSETEEEDPTKRWIHTNMDKLPENVGYCQKDV